MKRHLSPPPITRPCGQYEREVEKVLKGPKVVQLLRTVVALKKENQKLADQMAELSLELKSVRTTLRLSVVAFAPGLPV